KSGTKVRLQPQGFQILARLIESPGEIVSREDLCQRVWGSATFVDFHHSLATAIKRLRDSLNDSAHNPRFIETVGHRGTGIGYRFIATLSPAIVTTRVP